GQNSPKLSMAGAYGGAAAFSSNPAADMYPGIYRAARSLALLAMLAATACSGASSSSSGGAAASPSPSNIVDFPLFDGAEVLASRAFRETIGAKTNGTVGSLLGEGSGTYDVREVVAGTQAVMPALEEWLSKLDAAPPSGYVQALTGSGVDDARTHTQALGLDFAVFEGTGGGRRHGVVVLAVDPQTLDAKAGGMLGMIGKYKLLPKTLRDPIDAQAKKETGFTVTEMTEPDTPIGAAVGALAQLRDYGGRGVVLIDATKQ
ncbi:MAG TPA: hypothetical protein VMH02_08260, partial [Verrucomicrobiae bacterium]|nr:hypothetical protein [Verrucomicrobiae bacterium]